MELILLKIYNSNVLKEKNNLIHLFTNSGKSYEKTFKIVFKNIRGKTSRIGLLSLETYNGLAIGAKRQRRDREW